jgi:hypothetical protein
MGRGAYLHLMSRLRMSGAIYLLLLYAFMAVTFEPLKLGAWDVVWSQIVPTNADYVRVCVCVCIRRFGRKNGDSAELLGYVQRIWHIQNVHFSKMFFVEKIKWNWYKWHNKITNRLAEVEIYAIRKLFILSCIINVESYSYVQRHNF